MKQWGPRSGSPLDKAPIPVERNNSDPFFQSVGVPISTRNKRCAMSLNGCGVANKPPTWLVCIYLGSLVLIILRGQQTYLPKYLPNLPCLLFISWASHVSRTTVHGPNHSADPSQLRHLPRILWRSIYILPVCLRGGVSCRRNAENCQFATRLDAQTSRAGGFSAGWLPID